MATGRPPLSPANKLFRVAVPLLACGLSTLAGGAAQSGANTQTLMEQDVRNYLAGLDLSAKVGQMIQAEILNVQEAMDKYHARPIRDLGIGSVLAGGNSIIKDNSPAGWRKFLGNLQAEALASKAGLPLLTGVDAVHGHAIVKGATVFPHNIGLGAARDPDLMKQIGAATAREVLSTGFNWTFAPAVSVARDPRWGRTYESLGESPELQTLLAGPFIEGLQETAVNSVYLSATAKHFLGDGGTQWGTGFKSWTTGIAGIDRGDTSGQLPELMAVHGQGYIEAIDVDVNTVMISYNLVNGLHMHGHKDLVANYLKKSKEDGGLGFNGLVISDWNAIDEIPFKEIKDPVQRYKAQVIQSVNAGIDMVMVEGRIVTSEEKTTAQQEIEYDTRYRYERVHQFILEAVAEGRIPLARIDDAVTRILRVKLKTGLIPATRNLHAARPASGNEVLRAVPGKEVLGDASHREIARDAVRKSLVLLKNDADALPIQKAKYSALCVIGSKADDFGVQAGAWTTGWQGTIGNEFKTEGARTILDGLRARAANENIPLYYSADGNQINAACRGEGSLRLVVIGENPYAEFLGDSNDLRLSTDDQSLLRKAQAGQGATAVILISGRPLIVTDQVGQWQALVAAWLPGSQGEGIADVLFGDYDFTGKLSQTWPSSMGQLPLVAGDQGLFPYGFGLQYENSAK